MIQATIIKDARTLFLIQPGTPGFFIFMILWRTFVIDAGGNEQNIFTAGPVEFLHLFHSLMVYSGSSLIETGNLGSVFLRV